MSQNTGDQRQFTDEEMQRLREMIDAIQDTYKRMPSCDAIVISALLSNVASVLMAIYAGKIVVEHATEKELLSIISTAHQVLDQRIAAEYEGNILTMIKAMRKQFNQEVTN